MKVTSAKMKAQARNAAANRAALAELDASRNVPGTEVTWAQVNATAARLGNASLAEAIRVTVAEKEAGNAPTPTVVSYDDAVAAAAADMAAYMAKK